MTLQQSPATAGVQLTRKGERFANHRLSKSANLQTSAIEQTVPTRDRFELIPKTGAVGAPVFLIERTDQAANLPLDETVLASGPLPKSVRKLRRLREEAEAEIERLIDLVDRIDGDADLEPSLAAPEPITFPPGQSRWAVGDCHDLEEDCDYREEGGDMEPSLGSFNVILGRSMVDGSALWPGQEQVTDVGVDQSDWASFASESEADLEGEFDGREDGHDAESDPAEDGIADGEALLDVALGLTRLTGFDGSGRREARRLLDARQG